MEFEVKKTGSLIKELRELNPGDVFYIPGDDIYCMKIDDKIKTDYLNAVNLDNGCCSLYKPYEEVVPVTMKATIENPYLRD